MKLVQSSQHLNVNSNLGIGLSSSHGRTQQVRAKESLQLFRSSTGSHRETVFEQDEPGIKHGCIDQYKGQPWIIGIDGLLPVLSQY